MKRDPYIKALTAAQRELERLSRRKQEIDKRILKLRQTAFSLTELTVRRATTQLDRVVQETGLTEACRDVLYGVAKPLTPREVRGELERLGYNFRRSGNPLASIHTVLKRLVRRKEARRLTTAYGKTAYEWARATASYVPPHAPLRLRKRRGASRKRKHSAKLRAV